jgi:hypothetical protein
VNIFGEIESLREFTQENLYIFYEFYFPPGWKVDNENEYYLIYKAEDIEEDNINKLKSISQVSSAYVEDIDDYKCNSNSNADLNSSKINPTQTHTSTISSNHGEKTFVHNISLPFELEMLGHNIILDKLPPKILLQINSTDSYGRHRIEGYCFLNIPLVTGSYKFEIPSYKPREDNYMKVFSFFLGGSRKIPDLKEIAKSSSKNENVRIFITRVTLIINL